MSSKLNRLADLEKRLQGGEIKLVMPDGQEVYIIGDAQKLFANAVREHQAGKLSETSELIKRSVLSSEPGGSCLLELARSLLNSPSEPEPPALEGKIEPGETVQ